MAFVLLARTFCDAVVHGLHVVDFVVVRISSTVQAVHGPSRPRALTELHSVRSRRVSGLSWIGHRGLLCATSRSALRDLPELLLLLRMYDDGEPSGKAKKGPSGEGPTSQLTATR